MKTNKPSTKKFRVSWKSFKINKTFIIFIECFTSFIGGYKIFTKDLYSFVVEVFIIEFPLFFLTITPSLILYVLNGMSFSGNSSIFLLLFVVLNMYSKFFIDIYFLFNNLIKDEEGKIIVWSPAKLTKENAVIYSKEKAKYIAYQDEIKRVEELQTSRNENLILKVGTDFNKFVSSLPASSKIYEVSSPFEKFPKITNYEFYISLNYLVIVPSIVSEVKEDFSDKHSWDIQSELSANPDYKFEYSKIYEKPYFKILIDNIEFYKIYGSINSVTKVDGGGSSLSGMIIGDLLAGDTGAIIGSRKPIKSTIHKIDNREIRLTFSLDGRKRIITMNGNCLSALDALIPEKFTR